MACFNQHSVTIFTWTCFIKHVWILNLGKWLTVISIAQSYTTACAAGESVVHADLYSRVSTSRGLLNKETVVSLLHFKLMPACWVYLDLHKTYFSESQEFLYVSCSLRKRHFDRLGIQGEVRGREEFLLVNPPGHLIWVPEWDVFVAFKINCS